MVSHNGCYKNLVSSSMYQISSKQVSTKYSEVSLSVEFEQNFGCTSVNI